MRLFASISVVILLLVSGSVWAGEGEASIDVAKQHYVSGLAFVEQGEYMLALQEFNAAYDTSPYFAVLYNIAQTEIALDRSLDAATTLSRYLKEGGDKIPAERIDRVKEQIAQLEAFLGVLNVSTEPPGAIITIDGCAVGRTPLDEPLRLAAGTHVIAAAVDDGRRVERSVTIGQGRPHEIVLQLPALPVTIEREKIIEITRIAPPAKPPSGPGRLRKALPHALAGLGVALAVGAVGTYVFWERKAYERWQDAQPVLESLQSQQGSPDYASAAAESNRRADSVTAAKYTVVGLAIAGGATIAAGSVLYLLDRRSKNTYATPAVSWNGGTSLTLGWRSSW